MPERPGRRGPIGVGIIGAGKFATMFLSQIPTSPYLRVVAIADLDPARARTACASAGWSNEAIGRTLFTGDAAEVLEHRAVHVVIEATGDACAGIAHGLAAIARAKHLVMVNVEADVLAGPALAAKARAAGTVYSMAWGDQPALVCDLVDWARTCGFTVVAAGKGTRYQPWCHQINPDTVWDHYGLSAGQAAAAGMNAKMFASFMDGTKSSIEMAAIANATGLGVPQDGLKFPACSADQLQHVLIPEADGGVLAASGMLEVVASEARGSDVELAQNLRWGVYVVIEAPNDYSAACFAQYGLDPGGGGRFAALYRPCHLIGLELGVSVARAVFEGRATGTSRHWTGDVVAVAKRDIAPGETLDGEGGYCAWGKLIPAARSRRMNAVPIGLAQNVTANAPIKAGDIICEDHISPYPPSIALETRRAMVAAGT